MKAIQIHYVTGHYMLSASKQQHVVVFDSSPSQRHLNEVIPQLSILYEHFDISNVKYTTPQNQGTSTLFGVFVVANAVAILNDIDPHSRTFAADQMRRHFHKCLQDGEITIFPTAEVLSKDQTIPNRNKAE